MEVLEANDGPSGLEEARAEAPDVILLDVMMPALDGWRVAEQLLDDESTQDIPIIFLTARAEFRDRARGLDIGGVDYVTKPFNPLELAALVRDLLERIERGERDDTAPREARASFARSWSPSSGDRVRLTSRRDVAQPGRAPRFGTRRPSVRIRPSRLDPYDLPGARSRPELDAARGVPRSGRPHRASARFHRAACVSLARDRQHPRRADRDRGGRAARRSGAAALAYGLTPSFAAYPGSPTLRLETYVHVIRDLLDSLHGQGFRRVLIVNGHGGNTPARPQVSEWLGAHARRAGALARLVERTARRGGVHAARPGVEPRRVVGELPVDATRGRRVAARGEAGGRAGRPRPACARGRRPATAPSAASTRSPTTRCWRSGEREWRRCAPCSTAAGTSCCRSCTPRWGRCSSARWPSR